MLAASPQIARFKREARLFIDFGGLFDLADCMTINWDPARGSKAIKEWANLLKWLAYGHREVASKPFRSWKALHKGSQLLLSKLYYEKTRPQSPRRFTYETAHIENNIMREHLQAFLKEIYLPINAKATHCIDDTSHNILFTHRIKKWFPDAKIVWVMRDPYDVAICHKEARWGSDTFEHNARRVRYIMEKALETKGEMLLVRFESLVTHQVATLARVSSQLGIDGAKPVPLDSVKLQRWKELPPKSMRVIRKELSDVRKRLGYK
jgi:hypothetical protein